MNVIYLPSNIRALNDARTVINRMAERFGVTERKRIAAIRGAARLMAAGSSSAWAVQDARQNLRVAVATPVAGGAA